MSAIEIRDLVKYYKGSRIPAVDGLDLSIAEGEIYGFLGPNGAGKTTTISIICGLLRQTRGTVRLRGIDVARHTSRIKSLIGLVPQDIALYATLTARENLTYFARMHGLAGAELKRRVEESLALLGLEKSADQKISTYSGGMKRRANLVAGLVHQPPILILDEPTVGIDVQSRSVIHDNLMLLNKNCTTMIYATHDMEAAQQICHRVGIIDRGKILIEGPPGELVAQRSGCRNLEDLFLELTGRQLRD